MLMNLKKLSLSQNIMFIAVYGFEITSNKEDMPTRNRDMVDIVDHLLVPGWDAYKYIPFIHLLPSWLPGGRFPLLHQTLRETVENGADKPWNTFMENMVSSIPMD
jgi:hypothetical protein